ncbi:MAG: hypothetical protein IIC64_18535 [SAR324 cluster bacterium]|nr:hypothetical protein [SAR324 cluster bacterium]
MEGFINRHIFSALFIVAEGRRFHYPGKAKTWPGKAKTWPGKGANGSNAIPRSEGQYFNPIHGMGDPFFPGGIPWASRRMPSGVFPPRFCDLQLCKFVQPLDHPRHFGGFAFRYSVIGATLCIPLFPPGGAVSVISAIAGNYRHRWEDQPSSPIHAHRFSRQGESPLMVPGKTGGVVLAEKSTGLSGIAKGVCRRGSAFPSRNRPVDRSALSGLPGLKKHQQNMGFR